MCGPAALAAASFAVSAGQSIAQYQQQKAYANYQNKLYDQNKENSLAAMRDEYIGIQERQQQEAAAASQQIESRKIQQMQETATSRVASGESNVTGFSVDRVLADIGAVASRDISTIEQNRDWNISQLNEQLKGTKTTALSRINSVQKGIKPSIWGALLGVGASGVNAGVQYKSMGG